MKDDFPEEWLPTRKTKGREVPRSEFLARGPRREELRGIMEEWRSEHWDRMDCWTLEVGMLSLSLSSFLLSLSLEGDGEDFLDQFHVDAYLTLMDLFIELPMSKYLLSDLDHDANDDGDDGTGADGEVTESTRQVIALVHNNLFVELATMLRHCIMVHWLMALDGDAHATWYRRRAR